jgi:predicted HicB family RNase H-like nuclease
MTKTRKPGRPRRAKAASDDRVTVRLTKQERARYEADAAREGLSLGEWLRAAAELAHARGSTR